MMDIHTYIQKYMFLHVVICSLLLEINQAHNSSSIKKAPRTIHILGLFPLTGRHAARGELQLQAMNLAVNDSLRGDGGILKGMNIEITTADTQCNSQTETQLILQKLMKSGSNLFIVGGGCNDVTSGNQQASAIIAAAEIPQITFERTAVSENGVTKTFINMAPSIGNIIQAITSFITYQSWQRVILLSSTSDSYYKHSHALSRHFLSSGIQVIHTEATSIDNVISQSTIKIMVVSLSESSVIPSLCNNSFGLEEGRQVLLVLDGDGTLTDKLKNCKIPNKIFMFSLEDVDSTAEPSVEMKRLSGALGVSGSSPSDYLREASYAYAAMKHTLRYVKNYSKKGDPENSIVHWVTNDKDNTEDVQFTSQGYRIGNVVIHNIQDTNVKVIGQFGENLSVAVKPGMHDSLAKTNQFQGISLVAFVILSSLSCLGIVYASAILIFNVIKQNDRLIKLTSPYINIVVALGAILAYVSVGALGIECFLTDNHQVARLRHAATFTLTISSTLIYGSVLAKTWRVFMVFKNMQFNGKTTKDEHLLLGVIVILVIDVVVLLCWTYADPIVCMENNLSEKYEMSSDTLVTFTTRSCNSKFNIIWVLVIVGIKSAILTAMVYCAWQARHVTLPSLKDSQQIYASTSLTICMASIFVVMITSSGTSTNILYIISSICIISITTGTLSWLFIPKILLAQKYSVKKRKDDPVKFLFSESMRKTRAKSKEKSLNCFGKRSPERKYAHDLVVSEIENLKTAIKQKDATIRELTDRLFYGTEKFQTYLRTPKKGSDLEEEYRRKCLQSTDSVRSIDIDNLYINSRTNHNNSLRTVSELIDGPRESAISRAVGREHTRLSISSEESDEEIMHDGGTNMWSERHSGSENQAFQPTYNTQYSETAGDFHENGFPERKPQCAKNIMSVYMTDLQNKQLERPVSPNHDSAIENLSPSSDNNSDAFTENCRNGSDNIQVSVSDCGEIVDAVEKSYGSYLNGHMLRSSNNFEIRPDVFRPIPRHPIIGFDSSLDNVAVTEV